MTGNQKIPSGVKAFTFLVKYITMSGILLKVHLVLNDAAINSKPHVDIVDTLVLFSQLAIHYIINWNNLEKYWYLPLHRLLSREKNVKNILNEKRNALTPLSIVPRTLRLPVEYFIIWAIDVPHNISHRIYLRLFGYGHIMN